MTFQEFVKSRQWPGGYWGWPLEDPFFRDYLSRSKIDSRRGLLAWVRGRYPDFYYRRHPFAGDLTGREIMRAIWGSYLRTSCRQEVEE